FPPVSKEGVQILEILPGLQISKGQFLQEPDHGQDGVLAKPRLHGMGADAVESKMKDIPLHLPGSVCSLDPKFLLNLFQLLSGSSKPYFRDIGHCVYHRSAGNPDHTEFFRIRQFPVTFYLEPKDPLLRMDNREHR